jgi:hypothetical protein
LLALVPTAIQQLPDFRPEELSAVAWACGKLAWDAKGPIVATISTLLTALGGEVAERIDSMPLKVCVTSAYTQLAGTDFLLLKAWRQDNARVHSMPHRV